MNPEPLKIAIVASSLGVGGAERSSALLSVMLHNLGFDVHIITILDHIEYEYKGTLLNLGKLKNDDDTNWGRFKRLYVLRKYLKQHNFHRIIDNRTRTVWWSEWILSKWIYNPKKTLYVVRSFNISEYFPMKNSIARKIYRKSPYIIAVSDEIKTSIEKQYGYRNVIRIYNPAETPEAAVVFVPPRPFILAYGRLDDGVKNYSLLIEAYLLSGISSKTDLYIMGSGPDEKLLKSLAADHPTIRFLPFQKNPFDYVAAASFTVLSSRFEGFPRTIIESLSLGVPVISVDCSSGPAELIRNGHNGLLVPNHDPKALAEAMTRMTEDTVLYTFCKQNAASSITHLKMDSIANQWQKILTQ